MRRRTRVASAALSGVVAVALAACGTDTDGGDTGAAASDEPVVIGTTDVVSSLDPAGSYDLPSWTIIYNINQRLLEIPPGGNKPSPDAAESCDFKDETTYVCTLKEGLTFHDGSELTAEDVAFSLERVINIEDPTGPSSLLASLKSVKATDDRTVTMKLTQPDATWPFILTTGAGAIVPSDVYPADKLQPSEEVVGSGPYQMAEYADGERAVMEPFADYNGPAEVKNAGAIVSYIDQESALALAVKNGDVDVAYRSLSPTTVEDLRNTDGVQIVEGAGTEIRYIVFNTKLDPGQDLAARQAMAMLVDRQSIADNVYDGTVQPLYSMVPEGLEFATKAFAEEYGETPDPDRARQVLEDAGVETPVEVQLWWTPSRYGEVSADEYAALKRQFEADGLFQVELKSAEWNQYSEAFSEDQYPVFQLGWFPDFPDADNYTAPFFVDGGFYNNGYTNEEINELVSEERASTDESVRQQAFERIQQIAAEDVPTIPIWQGKQLAAAQDNVSGVEDTFDPSFTFRFYLVSKTAE